MKEYLTKILDWKTDAVTNQYDELPFWSSPFGTLLLDNFPIGNYKQYIDIGCGTGFPLIDISQRLGNECKSYGVDPWHAAINRAHEKIDTIGLTNVELIEGDASSLPFDENSVDLITSNLGINNFENPLPVLRESYRILKNGSSFCTTSNLNGTFNEFYSIFEITLKELGLFEKYQHEYSLHVNHRGSIKSMREILELAGFKITTQIESDSSLRYLNGSAFLNHSVIIVGFIDPWRNLLEEQDKAVFFDKLEDNLNEYSVEKGELKVTIPMVYFECKK
jgi:arsenite methyltransferase